MSEGPCGLARRRSNADATGWRQTLRDRAASGCSAGQRRAIQRCAEVAGDGLEPGGYRCELGLQRHARNSWQTLPPPWGYDGRAKMFCAGLSAGVSLDVLNCEKGDV